MSIIKSYMVPHPPMIIPKIGKGSEHQIEKTISSYEKVAQEIASLNPETIIITSPHAPMYSDYFYLSSEEYISGSLSQFGTPEISFNEKVDTELVKEITKIADINNFPTGNLADTVNLDHGTIVPLYFIRKYLKSCKIIVVGLSTLPLVDNYKMGQIIKEAVNNLNRRVVFVASGDLSHKLQEYGPYGYAKEGPEYDKRIMEVCSSANFEELFKFESSFLDKSAECGHRSFTIMAGSLDGLNITAKELSHEDITGVGYGICTFTPESDNKDRRLLDKYLKELKDKLTKQNNESDEYVKLAYQTIKEYITTGKIIEIPNYISGDLLNKQAAVFVSIHKFDCLRGCIGTTSPTKECIANEIIANAISASTQDPRFQTITKDELEWLEINVDVLSPPEEITSKAELDVKKYGVIVSSGFKRGLLLPDLEGIDTVEEQIKIAKKKGNIKDNENIKLERFKVTRHK